MTPLSASTQAAVWYAPIGAYADSSAHMVAGNSSIAIRPPKVPRQSSLLHPSVAYSLLLQPGVEPNPGPSGGGEIAAPTGGGADAGTGNHEVG